MDAPVSQSQPVARPGHRLPALDGLRGVAIVLVILFHCYARWADVMPWATPHRFFPLFRYGYLGVELFFLISGFVILMTLERCPGFWSFIYRRWLRLFPAMLIASALVYASAAWLHERPAGMPRGMDLFPGLLFVEPAVFNKLFKVNASAIEGAFWSLFVEVKFYLIFGVIYFINKKKSVFILAGLFLMAVLYKLASALYPELKLPFEGAIYLLTSIEYFGWFAIGAFLFKAHQEKSHRYFHCSWLMLAPAIVGSVGYDPAVAFGCVLVYVLFAATLLIERISRLFSSPPWLFLGFVSYPLYLIHENAMVSLAVKFHHAFPAVPGMLTPLPGLLLIVVVSFVMAKYLEPRLRSVLTAVFGGAARIRRAAPSAPK
jgi:peptidoglycan/LPS O-acetylase OafA/YrhL